MICPKCKKEYNEKMTLCISCGAELVPYDCETEQTFFEAIIPETPAAEEIPSDESKGFVRELPRFTEPQTEQTEIPLTAVRKKVSVSGAARFTGSLVTSLFMLAFILVSSSASALRLVTDEKNIAEFSESLDVMSLPAAQTVIPCESYGIAEDATVQEAVFVMSQGTGLSREDIRTIYENSTMRDFLASQLSGYAGFIRDGKAPEKLTAEKLKGVFSENLGLIGSTMGQPLSQHDIDLAFSEIDRVQPVLEEISPSKLEAEYGESTFAALRLFGSAPLIVSTAALSAAMLPLLRAINNKKSAKMLLWGGIAVLAGGAAVLGATFLFSVQLPFSGWNMLERSIAGCASDVVAPDLYRIGGTLAVLGLVMLIWSGTLRKHAE